MVNGRMKLAKGPILFTSSCFCAPATYNQGDAISSRYTCFPEGPQMVLCALLFTSIFLTISPVAQSTTFQKPFSKEGSHMVLPSGEIAMRSQPPSNDFSQRSLSVERSIRCSDSMVLI